MVLFQRSKPAQVNVDISYGGDEYGDVYQSTQNSKNRFGNSHYASLPKLQSKSPKSSFIRSPFANDRELKNSKSSRFLSIAQYLVIGMLCVLCLRSYSSVDRVNGELAKLNEEYESTHEHLVDIEHELEVAHNDFHVLQMKMLAGKSSRSVSDPSERKEITEQIIQKQEHQIDRIDQLKKSIQKNYAIELLRRWVIAMVRYIIIFSAFSLNDVLFFCSNRFGQGPYHVEFRVNVNGMKTFLTVETAPNNVMPHSVYYFMDMVDRNVWDSTVLIHDVDHIITAALMSPDGVDKEPLVEERLAFPEYSHEFAHAEYTVGFAGTGPTFYFNIRDNTEHHGPNGGGVQNTLDEADPCFAKVVIGGETMELLKEMSLVAGKSSGDMVFSHIEQATRIELPPGRLEELKEVKNSTS